MLDKLDINNIKILETFYLLNILQTLNPASIHFNPDAQRYTREIKDNYFHLQNFAFLGLITLNLGSKEQTSNYDELSKKWVSYDEIHPGKFETNTFGKKFLIIIGLLNQ